MSKLEAIRQPVTVGLAASLFFSGVTFSSTMPYNGIAGIEALGIPNEIYAILITAGSIVSAIASVVLGFLSDKVRDRRLLVIYCALAGAFGYGLLFLVREQWAFFLTFGVIMPFGFALFSQTFSFSRSFYDLRYPDVAEFMGSMLRTIFAVAWVIMPPIAGWLAATYEVFSVYGISAAAYLAVGGIFGLMMRDERTRVRPAASPASDKTGPKKTRAVDFSVLVGIGGVTLIMVAVQLNNVTTPLAIINNFGGNLGQVGVYASLAAALEIPFMVMWGFALSRLPKFAIIAINGAIYALYLLLLSRAETVVDVYWLQGFNAIATAALMSIPITYMQDAIRGRIGLSTSLMDVSRVVAVMIAAAIFGIISTRLGYLPVFVVAAALSGAGTLVLMLAHMRWRKSA